MFHFYLLFVPYLTINIRLEKKDDLKAGHAKTQKNTVHLSFQLLEALH